MENKKSYLLRKIPVISEELERIRNLEDSKNYNEAFDSYLELWILVEGTHIELLKHFHFFLWYLAEDFEKNFTKDIDLIPLRQEVLEKGRLLFSEQADFNFIAGYTIGIFPYEYYSATKESGASEYEKYETFSKEMLHKAHELEPSNLIYKMCYLGSIFNQKDYYKTREEALPAVKNTFSGNGLMNEYFLDVLSYKPEKPRKLSIWQKIFN